MYTKVKREWQRAVSKVLPHRLLHRFRQIRRQIGLPSLGELRRNLRGEKTARIEMQQKIELLEQNIQTQSEAIRWLVENQKWILNNHSHGNSQSLIAHDGPLISVIMPVWNRERYVAEAIQSVCDQSYQNWELLVVDDGSTDGTIAAIKPFLNDPRIMLFENEHAGVCAARNHAMEAANGEIFAYLDSDNQWFENYLEAVKDTFTNKANSQTTYCAQLVEHSTKNWCYIEDNKYTRERFLSVGGIDLNVFAHRRELFEEQGGFDDSLDRLVDWDLIARYTESHPPTHIPTVGCRYRVLGIERITTSGSYSRNKYLIQRKWQRPEVENMRVLYVVATFPQITETYIRWEIDCMQRWGVDVHVWSPSSNAISPYETDVPHCTGSLEDAIAKVKPSIVHFHWLHVASRFLKTVERFGAVATVRGHGFEFSHQQMGMLQAHPNVIAIHTFPHFAKMFKDMPKVRATPCGFNGDFYYPDGPKDTWLVVRAGSAKKAKATHDFIDAATQCPDHKFVLIIGRLNGLEEYPEEIIAYNESKGSPVKIHVNLPTEEVAAIVRKAGIYMHTYGDEEPFGMPISIAEAMATGCYTLVKNLPGAEDYLGVGGRIYNNVKHAVKLIHLTAAMYAEEWNDHQRRTVEYAYQRFSDLQVFRPMLEGWKEIIETGVDPAEIIEHATDPQLQPTISLINEANRAQPMNIFRRPFLTHLLGTYKILQEWNVDREVCLAGLVHSIYPSLGQQRLAPHTRES